MNCSSVSCSCVFFGHSSVLGATDRLDLVRLDLIPAASVAVKTKAICLLTSWFPTVCCWVFSAAFSSSNVQVKMAAEEKGRGRAPERPAEAEPGGQGEPGALRGRQLPEAGRFACAALCGISLAWLFPENEQRYKWSQAWAGQGEFGWWLSQSWYHTRCGVL